MITKRLIEMQLNVRNDTFFVGRANDKRIIEIEHLLGLKLPDSYKWFLKTYGHGGVFGLEIYGNGGGPIPSCVSATLNWRRYGLPPYYVVIEDPGSDWIYCIDTSKMNNDDCPVVDWEQNVGTGKEFYPSFLDFFQFRIEQSEPHR